MERRASKTAVSRWKRNAGYRETYVRLHVRGIVFAAGNTKRTGQVKYNRLAKVFERLCECLANTFYTSCPRNVWKFHWSVRFVRRVWAVGDYSYLTRTDKVLFLFRSFYVVTRLLCQRIFPSVHFTLDCISCWTIWLYFMIYVTLSNKLINKCKIFYFCRIEKKRKALVYGYCEFLYNDDTFSKRLY